MNIKARAQHAERLLNDEILNVAFDMVSMRLQGVFKDTTATDDEVIEARRMFNALEQVRGQLRRFVVDGKILDKKDQHRVHD